MVGGVASTQGLGQANSGIGPPPGVGTDRVGLVSPDRAVGQLAGRGFNTESQGCVMGLAGMCHRPWVVYYGSGVYHRIIRYDMGWSGVCPRRRGWVWDMSGIHLWNPLWCGLVGGWSSTLWVVMAHVGVYPRLP
jgi:hypothetical protein